MSCNVSEMDAAFPGSVTCVPPNNPISTTATFAPYDAALRAEAMPPDPAPMTRRSKSYCSSFSSTGASPLSSAVLEARRRVAFFASVKMAAVVAFCHAPLVANFGRILFISRAAWLWFGKRDANAAVEKSFLVAAVEVVSEECLFISLIRRFVDSDSASTKKLLFLMEDVCR
ncbi:hypothetical protein ACHAXS_007634 [Conticribra weissflogii]